MLIIAEEQMAALEAAASRSFETRMIAHLNQYFREECLRAGEARIRDAISQTIARAAANGITNEIDVARYIDLSVALGLSSDPDKAQKWLPEIPEALMLEPAAKLRMIFEHVMRVRAEEATALDQKP
jgi:hypothetical protein